MNADGPPMPIVHPDQAAPAGVCGRWTGTAPCGALAVTHVIWDLDVHNSLVCATHEAEAREAVHVGLHPYAPAVCSHPAARWYADVDLCAVDYPVDEGAAEAAAEVRADA